VNAAALHVKLAVLLGALLLAPLAPATAQQVLDTTGLSKTVAACTDFDAYVNGAWQQATPMPADRGRIGSFDTLRTESRRQLELALAEAEKNPDVLDTQGKRLVAAYYASGMDTAASEKAGLSALHPWLRDIDAIADRKQLATMIGRLARLGVGAPLAVFVYPDQKDRRRNILQVAQAGLGLPDRDDYTRDDARTQAIRAAYDRYRGSLLALSGIKAEDAARLSPQVYALEARLAGAALTRVARRDPNAIYNPHTRASLARLAPAFDWDAWLAGLGAAEPGSFNVAEPAFVVAMARAAETLPLDVWRAFLRIRLLDEAAVRLPQAFLDARFDYHGRAISGLQQPPPRVERVIDTISGRNGGEPLGQALGELYVARAFSPEAKARSLAMIDDVKAALRARIAKLEWMSAPTKQRALKKLDAMAVKMGYPDRWKTYEGLQIARDDYAGNWLRAAEWQFADRLRDLGRPVDRTRWFQSPHIVNAWAGGLNEITFPAAILQPPFFNARADDAVNFGGIGSVIGHEITHHFDDRGRQFDDVGNLADWWTPDDAAAYKARAARIAAQYSGYLPLADQPINGQQTLGENISDIGGIQIAYDGLQIALARRPAPARIDGFTPQQRFFIANAVIWRSKQRDEALINQLRTGAHSPGRFRVLGPLAHMGAFAEAFDCLPDAPMMRPLAERAAIW
jgi:putative endopeptidase